MASRQITDDELSRRVGHWLACRRNTPEAARTYLTPEGKKLAASTYRETIREAKSRGLLADTIQPVTQLDDRIPPEQPKIRVTVSHRKNDSGWSGDVLAIGDMHDSHRLDKKRFLWCGRAAAELSVKDIIQIGDIFSFDSLCRYDANDSLKGKDKPSFETDIQSGHDALGAFDRGLGGYPCNKHITLGNHEDRAISFTNRTPEVAGMLTGMVDNLFMSHQWTYSPFGLVYFIGSVGFVHAPLTMVGRPYGGKTALQRVGNDTVHDLVYGHTHKRGEFQCPKIGTNQKVTVLDLGCGLPQGHVEPYVGHGTSGWWYGVNVIKIRDGRISSVQATTMQELEERFGD